MNDVNDRSKNPLVEELSRFLHTSLNKLERISVDDGIDDELKDVLYKMEEFKIDRYVQVLQGLTALAELDYSLDECRLASDVLPRLDDKHNERLDQVRRHLDSIGGLPYKETYSQRKEMEAFHLWEFRVSGTTYGGSAIVKAQTLDEAKRELRIGNIVYSDRLYEYTYPHWQGAIKYRFWTIVESIGLDEAGDLSDDSRVEVLRLSHQARRLYKIFLRLHNELIAAAHVQAFSIAEAKWRVISGKFEEDLGLVDKLRSPDNFGLSEAFHQLGLFGKDKVQAGQYTLSFHASS